MKKKYVIIEMISQQNQLKLGRNIPKPRRNLYESMVSIVEKIPLERIKDTHSFVTIEVDPNCVYPQGDILVCKGEMRVKKIQSIAEVLKDEKVPILVD